MRYIVATGLVGLVLFFGCSHESTTPTANQMPAWTLDNLHELRIDPQTAGDFHNQFLDLMFASKNESSGFVLEDFVAAFEEVFEEYGITSEVIADVIESFTPKFNQLVDTHALTFPHTQILDAPTMASYLIDIGAFTEEERGDLMDFLESLSVDNKSVSDLGNLANSRIENGDSGGIACASGIMRGSSLYWGQKHEPASNGEIVLADTAGALIGFIFGGAGSIIGGGICSYAAAIYCEDVGEH